MRKISWVALVLGDFSSFQTATSAICSIGSTGTYTFAQPPGDVWFLVAGLEGAAFSSLGQATAGERLVSGIPAACPSITAQNTTAICP